MPWTDEQVEKLRQMWVEGLTANEIAKKLGVSKNSIVGKVHRLCLKARPSPIKKKENAEATLVSEVTEVSEEAVKTVDESVEAEEIAVEADSIERVAREKVAAVKKNPGKHSVKLVELDSHTCRWPIGDPRDDDFCFCGKKVKTGQTYCDEHSAVAYVKAIKK